MRCSCCNAELTDYETTLRHAFTKKFLELCQACIGSMDNAIPVLCRPDLMSEGDDTYTEVDYDAIEDKDVNDYDDGLEDYWSER